MELICKIGIYGEKVSSWEEEGRGFGKVGIGENNVGEEKKENDIKFRRPLSRPTTSRSHFASSFFAVYQPGNFFVVKVLPLICAA